MPDNLPATTTPVEVWPKDWYTSKTHWLQIVGAISTLGTVILGWEELDSDTIIAIVMVIQLAVNGLTMVVRQYTSQPVTPMIERKKPTVIEAVPIEPQVKEAARMTNAVRRNHHA